MFCPNCGVKLEDGSAFCINCGKKLPPKPVVPSENTQPAQPVYTQPVQPVYVQQPVKQPVQQPVKQPSAAYINYVKNSNGVCPTMLTVKRMASSPAMIIATVLFTVVTFFNTIGIMDVYDTFYSFIRSFRLFPSVDTDLMASIAMLFYLVPGYLITAGLWITVGSGFNRSTEDMTTAGLSLIKAALIDVLTSLIAVYFVLLFVMIGNSTRYSGFSFPAFLIVVGIMVISIIYLAKIIGMINEFKQTIESRRAVGFASKFVAVFGSIIGFYLILLSLGAGVAMASVDRIINGSGMIVTISLFCSGACFIVFGVFIFIYRVMIDRAYYIEREIQYYNSIN